MCPLDRSYVAEALTNVYSLTFEEVHRAGRQYGATALRSTCEPSGGHEHGGRHGHGQHGQHESRDYRGKRKSWLTELFD